MCDAMSISPYVFVSALGSNEMGRAPYIICYYHYSVLYCDHQTRDSSTETPYDGLSTQTDGPLDRLLDLAGMDGN